MNEIKEEVKKINNDIGNLKDFINDLEECFNIEHDDDKMKAIFHDDVNDEDNESEYNSSYEETEVDVHESDGEEESFDEDINKAVQNESSHKIAMMSNMSDNFTNSEKNEEANEENINEIEEGTTPAKNPSILTMENLIKCYINEFYEKTTSRQDKQIHSDLTKELKII